MRGAAEKGGRRDTEKGVERTEEGGEREGGREGVEGPLQGRGREEGKRQEGRREGGEEVNLHILERAGFFIKKRLKLIYACTLLTHCTL